MSDKLTKSEYWDQLDPDKLNLTKKEVLEFCHVCIDEWKSNKMGNFKYILGMELMIAQIKICPEPVLKMIWKKIIFWFYDLTYQNALANTNDKMLKEIRKIGSKKD
tara:strand:+ start:428 stop:745 length:318 start_codon:yes stop_codon:yes gene_type:complete